GAVEKYAQFNGFFGDLQRTCITQKFCDDVGDAASLIKDFFSVFDCVGSIGLGLDHLRVAGDRGEGIFEFMRDAGGEFAESGEVFSELHLLLERSECRQVTNQTECASGAFVCAPSTGAGDAACAMATG